MYKRVAWDQVDMCLRCLYYTMYYFVVQQKKRKVKLTKCEHGSKKFFRDKYEMYGYNVEKYNNIRKECTRLCQKYLM